MNLHFAQNNLVKETLRIELIILIGSPWKLQTSNIRHSLIHKKRLTICFVLQCQWTLQSEDSKRQAQTLYPLEFLRPRAFSYFLPFDWTYGLAELCGTPGALPKCFTASRAFFGPLRRIYINREIIFRVLPLKSS